MKKKYYHELFTVKQVVTCVKFSFQVPVLVALLDISAKLWVNMKNTLLISNVCPVMSFCTECCLNHMRHDSVPSSVVTFWLVMPKFPFPEARPGS